MSMDSIRLQLGNHVVLWSIIMIMYVDNVNNQR